MKYWHSHCKWTAPFPPRDDNPVFCPAPCSSSDETPPKSRAAAAAAAAAPASPTKCSLPMLDANNEHPTAHHGVLHATVKQKSGYNKIMGGPSVGEEVSLRVLRSSCFAHVVERNGEDDEEVHDYGDNIAG